MSLETQELRKIFAEIQSEFANTNEIQVHPVSGDPPSQYEVAYDIPCTTQDEKGNIVVGSNHVVTISIPFGFPHFPPSCKPKTNIFHPDFDSAAICLGDFWNRDRTIADLIQHIASMLRGDIYSVENAFNEEAATWFRDNSNQLPFAQGKNISSSTPTAPVIDEAEEIVDSSDDDEPTAALTDVSFPLSLEPTEEEGESEPLLFDDQEFMEDFQFPDNFPEAPGSHATPPPPAKTKADRDKLKQLARKRNFIQLHDELSLLDKSAELPEREDLEEKTAYALKEARKLYEDGEDFENQGLPHKALQCFKAAEELVKDFPNIRADILRTEQASELLKEISDPSDFEKQPQAEASDKSVKNKKTSTPPQAPKTPYSESTKRTVNIIPYLLAAGILCILAPLTYFYFTLGSHLTEARQLYSECTGSFAQKDFPAAEKSCLASEERTKGIFLIHQAEVAELQSGIRDIVDSEEMRQGLLGKVLYNEKYVPKSALTAHQSLQEMIEQGKGFLETAAWDQAAASFQKALELSRQIDDLSPDDLMDIEQQLNYAAFRSMLTVAENHVDNEEWQPATATLTELQGQISKLSPRQQVEYRDYIETLLAKSRFTSLKEQANSLFSQSDWDGAATLYQKAVEAGRSLSEKESSDLSGLQANITRAELYSTINDGNNAFSTGKWDTAIAKYTLAMGTLEANSKLLNAQEVEQSRQKLDRIILQSAIIRDRQTAEHSKATEDAATTLKHLQKVIDSIKESNFADDPEFVEIIAETEKAQKEMEQRMFIEDKEQYLVNNYTALFMENYPAATPETLNTPVATFQKRIGKLYLFKLQCTESGRGRPLKLIMFYVYNPDNGRWSFYNQK